MSKLFIAEKPELAKAIATGSSAITLISRGRLKPCQIARCVPSNCDSWVLARVVLLTICSTNKAGIKPTKIHKTANKVAGARMPNGGS